MTIFLRQSTASQEVLLGRFVDSTDGNTEETGLTIANTDIKVWKTGATTLANKNSGGGTHIANGVYYCVLDATDTDTIGPLELHVHVAGALYVKQVCTVLDEAMYDWLFGTAAPLAPTVAGRTLDVSAGGEAGVDWANVGSPTTTVGLSGTTVKTATDVETDTQDIQGRLPAALTGDGNIKADTLRVGGTLQTAGDLAALLATLATYVDTEVAAIKAKTDNLPSDPADASDIASSFTSLATTLSTIAGYIDTEVAAIKAKTDSLTFTVAGKVDSNPTAINGDATSASNLAKTTRAIGRGTVGSGSTTTSVVSSAMSPAGAVADQFKGRIVTFDADTTTAALRGQSTDITASSNAAAPTFTVTALTTAPSSGDTFSVT